MKMIMTLCAAILIAGGVLLYRHMAMPNSFGQFGGAPLTQVSDLIERPKDYQKKTVATEGVIREQCTSMGCFFFFHEGDKTLRVDLQEIAMTAPRKNGHLARVEGRMVPFGDGYQFYASAVEFK